MKDSNLLTDEAAFDLPRLCRYFSELSPQPMLAVEGSNHVVRHLNAAFARLAGRSAEELIGRPFAEALPEGDANGCLALLDRVFRTGTAETLLEQAHRQTLPAFWSYSMWAILGSDERPVGVMVQVSDATEVTTFRAQSMAMNESLLLSSLKQHELTETAEKLNDSLTERTQALADEHRRKDEFLAMLAHELRNPLAAIVNSVYLLALEKNETGNQQSARQIIGRQLGQLTRLVDDLMEISRISSGRVRLRPERVVLSGILEQAVETARPLIDERRHTLEVSLPAHQIWLAADAARLEQIVVNLLTNAAKYTPEGGRIWLAAEQDGEEAVIRVRDTGSGIAADLLPHVFDLFTQGERTLDRSQGGLGIGLALVRRLVELHQGRVEAQSTLGQGSEFVVRLPLGPSHEPTPPTLALESARPPTTATALRVLVVDDNEDMALSTAMLLQAAGHQTRLAHSGLEALDVARDYQPDLAILDIGLPGIDGYEVARRMRQQPGLHRVVLLAMSGYGQPSDFERSHAAGFDHHLVKPVPLAKLLEVLASVPARAV